MKTYIYTYERRKNDVNGNPRHWVTVYRMKKNEPILLKVKENVGYRGELQTVFEVIADVEKWGKQKYHYSSGYNCNGVEKANRNGKVIAFRV